MVPLVVKPRTVLAPSRIFDPGALARLLAIAIVILATAAAAALATTLLPQPDPRAAAALSTYAATGHHGAMRRAGVDPQTAIVPVTDTWAADDSARGTRPDASH